MFAAPFFNLGPQMTEVPTGIRTETGRQNLERIRVRLRCRVCLRLSPRAASMLCGCTLDRSARACYVCCASPYQSNWRAKTSTAVTTLGAADVSRCVLPTVCLVLGATYHASHFLMHTARVLSMKLLVSLDLRLLSPAPSNRISSRLTRRLVSMKSGVYL